MSRAPLAFVPLFALAAACGTATPAPGTTVACTVPAGTAQTLASDTARTEFLALDADHVYFQTQAGVFSVMKDGTALTKLPMTVPPTMSAPNFTRQELGGVAVDATDVYFAAGPTIFRMPKAGGTVAAVASSTRADDGQIGEIAMDAVNVYWVDFYYGAVYMAGKATPGGSFTTRLALAGRRPHYLAIDDTTVFWTNEDDLSAYRVEKDGTGLATFHTGAGGLRGIAVDATNLFWVESSVGLVKAAKDGTNPVVLHADVLSHPSALVLDATTVYVRNGSRSFATVHKDGTGYASDPTDPDLTQNVAGGIAVDGNSVFWSLGSGGGKVLRACK